MCNICRIKITVKMKRFFKIFGLAAVLALFASCKMNTQSTSSMSFGFDNADAEMIGYADYVDSGNPESGVIWKLHLYSGGIQTAYITLDAAEGTDSFLPTGTFKCGTSKSPAIGTFIQGHVNEEGTPQSSYVITGSDGNYTYYSLLTDGTFNITNDKDDYNVSGSMFSYSTVVTISFKGEVKYPNEEGEVEE